MKAFRKLLVADFKQFYRDRTALFFTFAFPILFMLVFGLVFSGDESVNYTIGLVILDEDSETGLMVAEALDQVPIFTMVYGDLEESLEALRDGDFRAVIALPPNNMAADYAPGRPDEITVYYDPARATNAQVLLPVIRQVIGEIERQISRQPRLLTLTEESIQSQHLRTIDFMVPGIMAMSILFLGMFGGLPLVEWREKKILKRLGASPLNRGTVVYSQVTYRLVLSIIQAVIIVTIARFVFDVQMVGSWWLLLGILLLGALTFISIGYFAVARARTVEGAMPIIQIVQFPMMFLSGIFFPIDMMPDFMRPIMAALPLTYLGDAFRQVMVDATPLYPLGVDLAVLAGWLVICVVLTIRLFTWE